MGAAAGGMGQGTPGSPSLRTDRLRPAQSLVGVGMGDWELMDDPPEPVLMPNLIFIYV